MTIPATQNKACHNCRRKRLKCDRNVPSCLKCAQRGYECLGYRSLFRWEQGMASRGKLRGATFESLAKTKERSNSQELQLLRAITDPLLQDLCNASRRHLFYCYPCLLQIVIAISALHMSNASEGHLATSSRNFTCVGSQSSLLSSDLAFSQKTNSESALTAKQRALELLNIAIGQMESTDLDGILATVLLFVQFEIMDSGRNEWKNHVRGARVLIDMARRSEINAAQPISSLRRCLISNCLVYDIIGATFASHKSAVLNDTVLNCDLSLLRDDEGNHCSSFPMPLLYLIQNGVRLSEESDSFTNPVLCTAREKQAHLLLQSARSFDPQTWAAHVQVNSPHPDLAVRTHIASAHQAATCIYLTRLLLKESPTFPVLQYLENLVLNIQIHLSNIPPHDSIIAATAWPSFIAGAEANDSAIECWAQSQLQNIWAVQPWGLVKGALAVLRMIWARRRRYRGCENTHTSVEKEESENWIAYMKNMGVDWLIL